jgi:hypothetical protein
MCLSYAVRPTKIFLYTHYIITIELLYNSYIVFDGQ